MELKDIMMVGKKAVLTVVALVMLTVGCWLVGLVIGSEEGFLVGC